MPISIHESSACEVVSAISWDGHSNSLVVIVARGLSRSEEYPARRLNQRWTWASQIKPSIGNLRHSLLMQNLHHCKFPNLMLASLHFIPELALPASLTCGSYRSTGRWRKHSQNDRGWAVCSALEISCLTGEECANNQHISSIPHQAHLDKKNCLSMPLL